MPLRTCASTPLRKSLDTKYTSALNTLHMSDGLGNVIERAVLENGFLRWDAGGYYGWRLSIEMLPSTVK